MVVRYFRPQISFGRIYATVDPSPNTGWKSLHWPGFADLRLRTTIEHRLKFEQLCSAIDQRRPVLVLFTIRALRPLIGCRLWLRPLP